MKHEHVPNHGEPLNRQLGDAERSGSADAARKYVDPIYAITREDVRKEVTDLSNEIIENVEQRNILPETLYERARKLNHPSIDSIILDLPDDTIFKLENGKELPMSEVKLINQKTEDQETEEAVEGFQKTGSETGFENFKFPNEKEREKEITLEELFAGAQSKEELIAIIEKSKDLEYGIQGTQQIYSKDELIALIDATWQGAVGIDHLPRTAGFREAVDRVRQIERESNSRIAKQVTAEQIEPAIDATIEMEHMLEVPKEERIYDRDKDGTAVIYYEQKPDTREYREKNKGIFGRLWAAIQGKKKS